MPETTITISHHHNEGPERVFLACLSQHCPQLLGHDLVDGGERATMLQTDPEPHFGNRTKCDFQFPGCPLWLLGWPVLPLHTPTPKSFTLALVRLPSAPRSTIPMPTLQLHPLVLQPLDPNSDRQGRDLQGQGRLKDM